MNARTIRPISLFILTAVAAALAWALMGGLSVFSLDGPTMPAAVDLTAQISTNPASPGVGELVNIDIVVSNLGANGTGSNLAAYLYIDPVDRPPTAATAGARRISGPTSLGGGASFEFTHQHTFTTQGCDHVVYVWVDRDELISESNDLNNLIALPVCVGVECEVDSYETDNVCTAAGWLSEDTTQARSFCDPVDKQLADRDWVKFTAFTGVTYTLSTANLGVHADPKLTLYASCGGAAIPGQGTGLTWQAPASGVYFAQIEHRDPPYGPQTGYDLTLSAATGVTDKYEPDNRCALARDITTNGARQSHLFQAPNDEDWIKFAIHAGESFALIADNTATGVNPILSLFTDCDGTPLSTSTVQAAVARLDAGSATDQVYFAKAVNQEPATYGVDAHYDVRVLASTCVPDGREEDDSFGQAKTLGLGDAGASHNVCPAGDEDWAKVALQKGKIYVISTANLGSAADTVIFLRDGAGTLIASNDDYGYTKASRIVFEPTTPGDYFIMARHQDSTASGPDTGFDLRVEEGVCNPDDQEGATGDNGPGDAGSINLDGTPQPFNFCADPLSPSLGDQDWVRFPAVAGGVYYIETKGLGPNSDTVLQLYDRDGTSLIQSNDDAGSGRSASLVFTATVPGDYFVRATQYNSNIAGADTNYEVQILADIPPTPTPTPTATPSPTPTPTPTVTPEPSTIQTLILVNRERLRSAYAEPAVNDLVSKLFTLADHERVEGVVIPLENDPAVAAAYGAWTANLGSLEDSDLANNVTSAIRNLIMDFLVNAPNVNYVVLVGDDRMIPFRRVPEGTLIQQEQDYAPSVSAGATVAAALNANMVLTDDYFVDREFSDWKGHEFYVPDMATGRLVESPEEMGAFIDAFLAAPVNTVSNVLVTGYDFVQDSGNSISTLTEYDNLTTDATLIGPIWPADALRAKQLNASPRFDLQSINGHSSHVATGVPSGTEIQAAEIVNGTADLAGALIYAVGCHAGLTDPGVLDLPQAFLQKRATYVGNTGYGWGGGGIVYSEGLMRNFTRELLQETSAEIGPALVKAKQKYVDRAFVFNAYDAKSLMQSTLFGLPMAVVTSGGALAGDDDFPNVDTSVQPPTAFGDLSMGALAYGLPNSFGAFGDNSSGDGSFLDLNDSISFSAGQPIQPRFYADVSAPNAGRLRGVLFLGGNYSDTLGYDPVVARPHNEYITDTTEPSFTGDGWTPQLPFSLQSGTGSSGTGDTVVLSLGQFNGDQDTERVYEQMAFSTLYSDSSDVMPPTLHFVDGVLNANLGQGTIKVEAADTSGVAQVQVAFTDNPLSGQGTWFSSSLTFEPATQKWTGEITGTITTRYFVQVVDGAGNVTTGDNKGRYYSLLPPLPLAAGSPLPQRNLFLPMLVR